MPAGLQLLKNSLKAAGRHGTAGAKREQAGPLLPVDESVWLVACVVPGLMLGDVWTSGKAMVIMGEHAIHWYNGDDVYLVKACDEIDCIAE